MTHDDGSNPMGYTYEERLRGPVSAGRPEDPAETARWEAEKREAAPTDTDWLKMELIGSGWVRRRRQDDHLCEPPMREVSFTVPVAFRKPGGPVGVHRQQRPDGQPGDLWRCGCGRLWEIELVQGPGNLLLRSPVWHRASLWSRLTWWLP